MMVMIMTRPATCAEHSMVWPRCQRSSGRLPDAWDPALKVWGSDYSSDIWSPQHGINLLFVFLRIWYNLRQNVLSVCKPFDFNVNACRLNHVTKNRQAMENHLKNDSWFFFFAKSWNFTSDLRSLVSTVRRTFSSLTVTENKESVKRRWQSKICFKIRLSYYDTDAATVGVDDVDGE